jgi:uncharacterized membrane protein
MSTNTEAQALASSTTQRKKRSFSGLIPWIIMAVLAIGIALYYAGPYITWNPAVSRIPLNPAAAWHFTILAIHAITGGTVLIVGPFQFLPKLRAKYPTVHRVTGRVYMIGVVIGSLAAFYSAAVSLDGFVAQVGFFFLAALWLYSIIRAYIAIRQRNIQQHRIWMIRNYALTFSAVTLRLWLGVGITYLVITHQLHGPATQTDVYVSGVWFAILSSVVIADWFINQRIIRSRFK